MYRSSQTLPILIRPTAMTSKETCAPRGNLRQCSEETTVYPLRRAARRIAARGCAALGLTATLLLAGCHNFFVCQKASCPSGGGGSTTSDWVYVSNASAGSNDISAYDIGNGSLAAISGSPFNIGFAPVAMSRLPQQRLPLRGDAARRHQPRHLPVRPSTPSGALSVSQQRQRAHHHRGLLHGHLARRQLPLRPQLAGTALTEYQINTPPASCRSRQPPASRPPCTLAGTPVIQTCTVTVAPSGQFVVASLGTAGTAIFPTPALRASPAPVTR